MIIKRNVKTLKVIDRKAVNTNASGVGVVRSVRCVAIALRCKSHICHFYPNLHFHLVFSFGLRISRDLSCAGQVSVAAV